MTEADYKDIFEKAKRDLHHLHGYYLTQMLSSQASEQQREKIAVQVHTMERVLTTIEEVAAKETTVVSTELETEYVEMSRARIKALRGLSNANDDDPEEEDKMKGPGVY